MTDNQIYDFIIDVSEWSFSRINSFDNCPYGWKLHYLEGIESEENFFSQFGSLMHSILEMYLKGELQVYELSKYYEETFDLAITVDPPYNRYVDLRESYYKKGLDYLDNIDLVVGDNKILGVEKKVRFKVDGFNMVGFIDLLIEDKDGELIVIDHKSAVLKFKKNGEISKTDAQHFLEFKRQMYLYSKAVYEEYGKFPKILAWNTFRERSWIKIEFKKEEYDEAIKWAGDTIRKIKDETLWLPNITNQNFCSTLCGMRSNGCEYCPLYNNPEDNKVKVVDNGKDWEFQEGE